MPESPDVVSTATFQPSEEQWVLIQKPYSIILSGVEKKTIATIVQEYFHLHEVEIAAPLVKDVLKKLDSFNTALVKIRGSLTKKIDGTYDEAAISARDAIVAGLREVRPEMKPKEIWELIPDLLEACLNARNSTLGIGSTGGFAEGSAWRIMINDLMDIVEEGQLPTSVAKGQAKQRAKVYSPFVEFVWQLQKCFPPRYKRHDGGKDGLGGAISKVKSTRPRRDVDPQK